MKGSHIRIQMNRALAPCLAVCGSRTEQAIVGIHVVDVIAGDELVLHEDGGRCRLLGQNIEGKVDDSVSVTLGEKSHRTNKWGARFAKFGPALPIGVLA